MNYFKIMPFAVISTTMLLISGCTNDINDQVQPLDQERLLWLTLNVTSPESQSSMLSKEHTSGRKYLDASKTKMESAISNLVAVLVDDDDTSTEKGKIKSVVVVPNSMITKPDADVNKYEVTIKMGPQHAFRRLNRYRLYVFANVSSQTEKKLESYQSKALDYLEANLTEQMEYVLPSQLDSKTMIMTTTKDDALKVEVYLDADTNYDESNPYIVTTSPNRNGVGTLQLTHAHAKLVIGEDPTEDSFTYSVKNQGANSVKVQLRKTIVRNVAGLEYVMEHKDANGVFSIPTLNSSNLISTTPLDFSSGTIAYVPENVALNTAVDYTKSTYLEMEGVLIANAETKCDADVKSALMAAENASHPNIYYYDDGTFQSNLTTKAPTGSAAEKAKWITIPYDNTLKGYKVTYRQILRHNATDGTNENDGVIKPMEYGVVRNHLYEIVVNSITSLPHHWNATDSPENGKQELDVKILVPQGWNYHRGAFEVEQN